MRILDTADLVRPTTYNDEIILHDGDRDKDDLERLGDLDGECKQRLKYRIGSNTERLRPVLL